MKRQVCVTFALVLFTSIFCRISYSEERYRFERMWPTLHQPWYFSYPAQISVTQNGVVYVADADNNRIQKLTEDGQFITAWGRAGTEEGAFSQPQGVAVSSRDEVYVSDTGNHRIQVFRSDGEFVRSWGTNGPDVGEFNGPTGIAVSQEGSVYVVDCGNNRVQQFTNEGNFERTWGSAGAGEGQFHLPSGISIDDSGRVFVTDDLNHRIQWFTSAGSFLGQWGNAGSGDGQFDAPQGITATDGGAVYVADTGNSRIQRFEWDSGEGQFVYTTQWGSFGSEPGDFYEPLGIAVGSGGHVYVVDRTKFAIQRFTAQGAFVAEWGTSSSRSGFFDVPGTLAVDAAGNIYVADAGNYRIQCFDQRGAFLFEWGAQGSGDGQFEWPYGIAADSDGFIYVVDYIAACVQKFDGSGAFVTRWGAEGTGDGEFNGPTGIAVDAAGNVYVADSANDRIQKFQWNAELGEYLYELEWNGSVGPGGAMDMPLGIAIDSENTVWVTDARNNQIQHFDSSGAYLSHWGSPGTGEVQFDTPKGIAVDEEGNLYVADRDNHRIQKVSPDGTFLTQWGGQGGRPGQFLRPGDVAVGSNGRIYVVDTNNARIQVFKLVALSTNSRAVVVAGGGPFPGNNLWDATQLCANFAYRTLTYQGFAKEDIRYLSSDLDLDLDNDGLANDVWADATNDNLHAALSDDWAIGADELVLYIVDHGGVGMFRMSGSETLSAVDLDSWLDQVQGAGEAEVTVLYDACESGSFVAGLVPPGGSPRTVITSTSPGESAYFVGTGNVSFSSFFWTDVFNGHDVAQAYGFSSQAIGLTIAKQNPLLDANGNGEGSENADLTLVSGSYIGNGTEQSEGRPVIGDVVVPTGTISGTSATIEALDVVDDEDVSTVWAVIHPPAFHSETTDNPVLMMPTALLDRVGSTNRFSTLYGGFTQTGTYQLAVYAKDISGTVSLPVLKTVTVGSPFRNKAVLVAGATASEPIWPAVESGISFAYESLAFQGYEEDDIYCLSPEAFLDLPMVDNTLDNLEYALQDWVGTDTQDLLLYMIGCGEDGVFSLKPPEVLPKQALGIWLDNVQNKIAGTIVVVYDASQSGSFLDELAPVDGHDRILITSCSTLETAYFLSGGQLSFSKFFWRMLLNGANLRDAFSQASRATQFSKQDGILVTPQLDDNGNGIGNESTDSLLAAQYVVGTGVVLAGDDPVIGAPCPEQVLTGERSANLWVSGVTTTGAIEQVWAVIQPPYAVPGYDACGGVLPIAELTEVEQGIYEGAYEDFSTPGFYSVTFFAMDKNGAISQPVLTAITQTAIDGPDLYEDDDAPERATWIGLDGPDQTHGFHVQDDADWVRFYAEQGDIVRIETFNLGPEADTYVELFRDDGTTLIDENDNLDPWTPGSMLDWTVDTTGFFLVRVTVADESGFGPGAYYDLRVWREAGPVLPGSLTGRVTDAEDGKGLPGAGISLSSFRHGIHRWHIRDSCPA